MATGYSAGRTVAHNMVTTQFELDGFRVTRTLGVVRGIVVRSRSIFGTIGAGLQTLVGGNITLLTNLCEKTRAEAFDLMLQHAAEIGGNAVVGARYDATEVMQGVTEVLAYGTRRLLEIPGLRLIGTAREKEGILSFVLEGIHPHDIGTILDREGIAIRTGHHCAQPLMQRFGVPATARASLALYNTAEEMDALADGLRKVREVFA